MTKGLSLCLMVVLALASSSLALECYYCTDCEHESDFYGTCPEGTDVCAKDYYEGKVRKQCAELAVCNEGAFGKLAEEEAEKNRTAEAALRKEAAEAAMNITKDITANAAAGKGKRAAGEAVNKPKSVMANAAVSKGNVTANTAVSKGNTSPLSTPTPIAENRTVLCCQSDFCNAASIKLMNPALLLLLPLALYFLHC